MKRSDLSRLKRFAAAALSAAILMPSSGLPVLAQQVVASPGAAAAAGLGAAGAGVPAAGWVAPAAGPGLGVDIRIGVDVAGGAIANPAPALGAAPSAAASAVKPRSAAPAVDSSPLWIVPAALPLSDIRGPGPQTRRAQTVAERRNRRTAAAPVRNPDAAEGRPGAGAGEAAAAAGPARDDSVDARGNEVPGEQGTVGALRDLVARGAPGERVFDGVGFVPLQKPHPLSGILDARPELPGKTGARDLSWDLTRTPVGLRLEHPSLVKRLFSWISGPARSVALPGDPQTDAGVEQALRQLIQDRPELFGGVLPENLVTVLASKVPGREGLADTIYVRFRQQQYHPQLGQHVAVEGTYLNFVVKIFGGKSVVVGSTAQLYPGLQVDTQDRPLGPAEILRRAREKLGAPSNEDLNDLHDLGARIMFLGRGADDKKWRTVQILASDKKAVMLAVDVNTGETFAWDPRIPASATADVAAGRRPAPPAPGDVPTPGGIAVGRGIADGPIEGGTPSVLPLAHIEVKTADGRSSFADKDGRFTVPGQGSDPVELTVRLSGRFASVTDSRGRDLTVTVTAKPGEELRVVFNPEGAEENHLAQVDAYYHTTLVHDWLVSHGINLPGLDKPMPVEVNIDDECNAYYTPWNPSLHFFKSSERCANTSYGDVNYHEYGHAYDDAAGSARSAARLAAISVLSILNGGLSEGIGDMLMIHITGQPVVGRGFLRGQNPGGIRDGRNTYQYRDSDEAHDQGQAFMGFVWKLREALIAAAGDAVRGAELTVALTVPVVLAKPRDIPAAIQQVLLRDVDSSGNIPHLKEIQAAAAAHGIEVRPPSAGGSDSGLLSRLARAFRR